MYRLNLLEATCILLTKQLSSEEGLHRDQASGWVSGLAYCPEDESTIVDVSKGETTLATTTTTSIPAFYTNTSTYPGKANDLQSTLIFSQSE